MDAQGRAGQTWAHAGSRREAQLHAGHAIIARRRAEQLYLTRVLEVERP